MQQPSAQAAASWSVGSLGLRGSGAGLSSGGSGFAEGVAAGFKLEGGIFERLVQFTNMLPLWPISPCCARGFRSNFYIERNVHFMNIQLVA